MENDMINVLISACLLGRPCRYDGKSKKCFDAIDEVNLIPICPECDGGLPTPRPPAEIVGDRVINKEGVDVTGEYRDGAYIALETARKFGCKLAILKEKSPSCGTGVVYDGSFTGKTRKGMGITAALLAENGIHVISENDDILPAISDIHMNIADCKSRV